MIEITRINQKKLIINAELIEFVESTPDTIITTTTGKKIIVADSTDDVVRKVVDYRRLCFPWKKFKPMTEDEIKFYLEENK